VIYAVFIPLDLLIVLSFAFIPWVTRKTELFGVTIPAQHSADPELQSLRRSYRNQMLAGGVALIALSVALFILLPPESVLTIVLWTLALLGYLALAFVAYLPKYFKMRAIKKSRQWDMAPADKPAVILADTAPPSRDTISPAWLLLTLVPIALTALALALAWPLIPDPVPTHFDINGAADAWRPKGPGAFAPIFGVQAMLTAVFAAVFPIVRKAKRQIDVDDPEGSRMRDIRYRRAVSVMLVAGAALMNLFMGAIMVLSSLPMVDTGLLLGICLALVIAVIAAGLIWFMLCVGQGGSRLAARPRRAKEAVNTAVNDDSHWALGQFYFNPADPSLFVEKRFGIGYTVNYARPSVWLIIAAFFLVIIGATVAIIMSAS
jgi:uncharacterized membrane protein